MAAQQVAPYLQDEQQIHRINLKGDDMSMLCSQLAKRNNAGCCISVFKVPVRHKT